MGVDVSIIVPVYNAETYLDACVQSILAQDGVSLELLLVNDGSKDGSLALCRSYEARDARVRVLDGPNRGVSAARNRGLEEARGESICFVDADDLLTGETTLRTMLDMLRAEDCDIAVADYARLWKERLLPTASSAAELAAWDRESRAFRFRGFYSVGCLSYVWAKLYRRAFLEQHVLWFPPLRYAEDKVFSIHCYFCGARYAFTGQPGYLYRMNPDSVSYQYRPDSCQQWLRAARQMQEDLQSSGGSAAYEDLIWDCIAFAAFFDGKMEYVANQRSWKAVERRLRLYGADPLAQKAFRELGSPKGVRGMGQKLWQLLLYGFSVAMRLHWYGVLSIGTKLLVDWRIDERLSDTGMRE